MKKTAWDMLLAGDKEQALRRFRKEFSDLSDSSHIMELGVAYLWAQEYQAAWEHFDAANRRRPRHMDIFYGMAGTAKWCLDEPDESIQQWRTGLRCQYADGAGGVESPLLLFVASVVKPRLIERSEAEKLLTIRANDPCVRNWPGAVAEFILGRIDIVTIRERCVGPDESDTLLGLWLIDFYVGVLEYAEGRKKRFRELMQKTSITSDDDFDVSKGQYLAKLWNPEFFIARHEASVHK